MPTVDGLPYPNSSATPDVPGDILLLVNAIARKNGGGIAYATNAAGLTALVTDGLVKEGMLAFQLDTKQLWYRESASWTDTRLIDDTGWITPTLGNSWTAVTAVQYRRYRGVVYLRGRATGGASGSAFNLPTGFRPPVDSTYGVFSGTVGTTAARVIIRAGGDVELVSASVPNLNDIPGFPADA